MTTSARPSSTFSRLAAMAGNPKKPADEIERRLAALEARAVKDDGEDADEDSKDDDTCDDQDPKKTRNKKAKDKNPKDGDNPNDPDDDTDDGDDTDPKASVTTTGSIVPFSAEKMKADKAIADQIIAAGNKRRGEK